MLRPKKKGVWLYSYGPKPIGSVGRIVLFFIFYFFTFHMALALVEAKEAKQVIKTTFNVKGCYMVGLLNTYMQLYSNMNAQKN